VHGTGHRFEVDPDLVVPDDTLSLGEGALAPWAGARFKYFTRLIDGIAALGEFDVDTPWKKLRAKDKKLVLYGVEKRSVPVKYRNRYGKVRTYDTTYAGIVDWLERKRNEADGTGHASRPSSTCARSSVARATGNVSSPRSSRSRCTDTTSPGEFDDHRRGDRPLRENSSSRSVRRRSRVASSKRSSNDSRS